MVDVVFLLGVQQAGAELVDERGSNRPVKSCGEGLVAGVKAGIRVGIAGIGLITGIGSPLEVIGYMPFHVGANLVVQAEGGIDLVVVVRILPDEFVLVGKNGGQLLNRFAGRGIDLLKLVRNERVHVGRETVVGRNGEDVHRVLLVVGAGVAEVAALGGGAQHRSIASSVPRNVFLLVIAEEEDFVLPDGAAQTAAEIADMVGGLFYALRVIRECVGVEGAVLRLPEGIAMKMICSALELEAQGCAAFSSGIGGQIIGRDSDFVDRAEAQGRRVVKASGRSAVALEVIVHAVDGDVERGVGHGVVGRESLIAATLRAGNKLGKGQGIASVERKVLDRVRINGSGEGVGGRLQHFGLIGNFHRLG